MSSVVVGLLALRVRRGRLKSHGWKAGETPCCGPFVRQQCVCEASPSESRAGVFAEMQDLRTAASTLYKQCFIGAAVPTTGRAPAPKKGPQISMSLGRSEIATRILRRCLVVERTERADCDDILHMMTSSPAST